MDGLEKASLANCDVVVGSSQSPQLKGKGGKLSSLGKIFKPWKWRKKRTSDKFQDLSKGKNSYLLIFVNVYAWDNTSNDLYSGCSYCILLILFLMLPHNLSYIIQHDIQIVIMFGWIR